MNLHIRRASPEDAGVVALLGRITFEETFGYLFAEHAADLRAYLDQTFAVGKIRASLQDPENRYWTAYADDLPVGYAKLKYPSGVPGRAAYNAGQLQKIYILRSFTGRGVGEPLWDSVLDDAANRSIPTIWLDVLKENTQAIRFYGRHGFATIGEDRFTIGAQTFEFHVMALRRNENG